MLTALARKELRLHRPAFVAALAIALIAYGVIWPVAWQANRAGDQRANVTTPPDLPAQLLLSCAVMGGLFSILLAAMFGGTTLPLERRQRWADFAATLPAGRWRSVGSRLLAAGGSFGLVMLTHAAIALLAIAWAMRFDPNLFRGDAFNDRGFRQMLGSVGGLSLGLFGLAWLLGSFLRSPAFAATIAIGAVLLACLLVMQVSGLTSGRDEWPIFRGFLIGSAIGGVAGLTGGTIYLARRREP